MRYYGNKTKLLEFIESNVERLTLPENPVFLDLFTGTGSVACHFKSLGFKVIANDFLYFCYVLAQARLANQAMPPFKALRRIGISNAIEHLNNLSGKTGFITSSYTPNSESGRQYFSVENGRRIDAIREQIHIWEGDTLINEDEKCYLLGSLLHATSKVSNISGTYGSYLKIWDPRAAKPLRLTELDLCPGQLGSFAINEDADKAVGKYHADVLYLDPPYNSRQYASNYFLLELIAEGWFEKEPVIYGHTGMRPYEHQRSDFSSRRHASAALNSIMSQARASYILVSYNDEGIIPINELSAILEVYGKVSSHVFRHRRYRSIGQTGEHNKTTEHLFVVKTQG